MIVWLATWIWQGLALTLVVWLALRVARVNAASRYGLWWMTLAGVLALAATGETQSSAQATVQLSPPDAAMAPILQVPSIPWMLVWMIVVAWMIFAAASLAKLAAALVQMRRLKAQTRWFSPERELRLTRWQALRQTGRPARLAVSDDIHGVVVFGLTRPQIAVSHELERHLTDDELDQIVLHEHAHVQRRDDWTQFLQVLLTAFIGLHPAVRWINKRLAFEREVACDDWVIAQTGHPRSYARCLTRVAEWPATHRSPTCAPAVVAHQSQLTARIERLLDVRRASGRQSSLTAVTCSIGVIAFSHWQIAAVPPLIAEWSPSRIATGGASIHLSKAPNLDVAVGKAPGPRPAVAVARRRVKQQPSLKPIDAIVAEMPPIEPASAPAPQPWLASRSYSPMEVNLTLDDTQQRVAIAYADDRRDGTTLQVGPDARKNRWTAMAASTRRAGLATARTATRAGISLASAFTLRREQP